jgi:hypothetical protein
MTTVATRSDFAGPFAAELGRIAELIDWLWANHRMSFVKAGDDKVYAYGGNGYILVFDESRWEGLIEVIAPGGAVTLKPGEDGKISVSATAQDDGSIKALMDDAVTKLRKYYEERYWNTPQVS